MKKTAQSEVFLIETSGMSAQKEREVTINSEKEMVETVVEFKLGE